MTDQKKPSQAAVEMANRISALLRDKGSSVDGAVEFVIAAIIDEGVEYLTGGFDAILSGGSVGLVHGIAERVLEKWRQQ